MLVGGRQTCVPALGCASRGAERLVLLRARLQRTAASASEAPGPSAPAAAAASQQQQQTAAASSQSFVTEEERGRFSASQLEFLERKRRAAAGLAPIFPDSCTCERCGGSGTAVCHQCDGSGVNASEKAEELFQNERGLVVQTNGRVNSAWFFRKDCPCWLCRGSGSIGCPDCAGSGMKGMADFTAD